MTTQSSRNQVGNLKVMSNRISKAQMPERRYILLNSNISLHFNRWLSLLKSPDIGDTNTLADGHRVQTILVGDHTDTAEFALWENFDTCEVEKSYKFTQLMVKIFQWHDKRSLFTPRENVGIEENADLQNVLESVIWYCHSRNCRSTQILNLLMLIEMLY